MTQAPKHLVRTAELPAAEAVHVRHPLNPASDVFIQRLGERAGMDRVVVSLARVPSGKESFVLHAHMRDEEFIYILEGTGTAVIGDAEVAVGPGDFMGFPIDGTPHHLKNTGSTDLVYLMGGERSGLDVGRFPGVGKVAVYSASGVEIFDEAAAQRLDLGDFLAKD